MCLMAGSTSLDISWYNWDLMICLEIKVVYLNL